MDKQSQRKETSGFLRLETKNASEIASKPSAPNRKLESSAHPCPSSKDGVLEVIVKVEKPNYIPKGVSVRAQISPQLFTSAISGTQLKTLEQDPKVQSVSVSRTLHSY